MVVLDIAGPAGGYCGKLFADMGAELILIEPEGGASSRRDEPRLHGRDDPDASLVFHYQNTNKKSIILDLDSEGGQAALRKLAGRANLLIESEAPGVMAARGLDYPALQAITPGLVTLSLTPFGQTGPYALWQSSDLVSMAMGGMLYLSGYRDSEPITACGEQAVGALNLFGAVAAMAAAYEAEISGEGQHVDVSMQECVVMGMENAAQFYELEGLVRGRNAGEQRLAGTGVFACRDGYVYLMAGGVGGNRFWPITAQWLIDEGLSRAEELLDPCWLDNAYLSSAPAKQKFLEIFGPFARAHTKAELEAKGRKHRIPIAPINNTSELNTAQRKHRNYFVDIQAGDGTLLTMPGAPYKLSRTPWAVNAPAPSPGQHTTQVLLEGGFTDAEIKALSHKEDLS